MIYLRLKGRFGNQLYQLGAALRLARGDSDLIKIHLGYLPSPNEVRLGFLLGSRHVPEFLAEKDLKVDPIAGQTFLLGDSPNGPFFDQQLLDAPIDLKTNHVVLDGYFQSGRNLAALRQYIYQDLTLADSPILRDIRPLPEGALVVHYRLGDYKKREVQNEIGLINLAYIDSAIEKFWDQKNECTIFSDGEEIRARYANRRGIKVIAGGDDMEVFRSMLGASTLIIPNSTFSLSAAFLSPHVKTLCRPLFWSRKHLADHLTADFNARLICVANSFYSF